MIAFFAILMHFHSPLRKWNWGSSLEVEHCYSHILKLGLEFTINWWNYEIPSLTSSLKSAAFLPALGGATTFFPSVHCFRCFFCVSDKLVHNDGP